MENHLLTQQVGYKVLDWSATEEKARGMTDAALHYAILDCIRTAREGIPEDAGYYTDQASVYRAEMVRRAR